MLARKFTQINQNHICLDCWNLECVNHIPKHIRQRKKIWTSYIASFKFQFLKLDLHDILKHCLVYCIMCFFKHCSTYGTLIFGIAKFVDFKKKVTDFFLKKIIIWSRSFLKLVEYFLCTVKWLIKLVVVLNKYYVQNRNKIWLLKLRNLGSRFDH